MNYEEMSDFEINSAVHNAVRKMGFRLEFLGCDRIKWSGVGEDIFTGKCDYTPNGLRDYCNNPSDAWPIINSAGIALIADSGRGVDGEWMACDGFWVPGEFVWNVDSKGENPLRAAMIVFLMMKDAECQKL